MRKPVHISLASVPAAIACALALAGAAGAGERVTVTYKQRFLIDTMSGELISREDDVLVVRSWREGDTRDIRIPFADLREINGEPAPIVISRWRKESEDPDAAPKEAPKEGQKDPEAAAAKEDRPSGEQVTIIYREAFTVRTIYGELLDRGGESLKVRDLAGRKRVLTIPRADVKSIGGEPAGQVFARWDREVGVLAAAAEVSGPAGPAVSLKYKDGFVFNFLSGLLVGRDMHRVVVRTTALGQLRDVAIPWKDIREYDGAPVDEAFARFRRENQARLCPACKGGTVVAKCNWCAGTGWTSGEWKPCRTCRGKGHIPCKSPGCKDGHLECPGPCLKLSQGTWIKNYDRKRWRKFPYGDGRYMAFSEDDVGKLVKRVNGVPGLAGPCATCGGTGKVSCGLCNATGKDTCPACNGLKKQPSRRNAKKCPDCKGGVVRCGKCAGTGLLPDKKDEKKKDAGKKDENKEAREGKQGKEGEEKTKK